jgi:hypothetical protein
MLLAAGNNSKKTALSIAALQANKGPQLPNFESRRRPP